MPKKTLMKIGLVTIMKTRLLAIVGSHRRNGNCYALAKSVLESTSSKFRIIQLASKKIEFCVLCEKCVHEDCVLTDDLNQILAEMKKADAIMFIFPKYLLASSKFLAFLERLDTIVHMRKHKGYKHTSQNQTIGSYRSNNLSAFLPCQARADSRRKHCVLS
jgi:multimeric flavodoxin WrbA